MKRKQLILGGGCAAVLVTVGWGVPNFAYFDCKAAQQEGKRILRLIAEAEQRHVVKTGRFAEIQELVEGDPNLGATLAEARRYSATISVRDGGYNGKASDARRPLIHTKGIGDVWIVSSTEPTPANRDNACNEDTALDFWLRRLD